MIFLMPHRNSCLLFLSFFLLYSFLAWLTSGGDSWWVLDYIDGQNVFFGDDAYRFFLSRSAWVNPDLYTYNFVLPGQLFLDGLIITLVQGNLFLARCFHAAVGTVGLCLVYLSALRLGVSKWVAISAVIIIGMLPRYALMSLSFYGEVWLSLFLCLAIFLYLRGNLITMAAVAGWLPLFRPEGIFFLVPLCLKMLLQRRVRELFLLLMPGSLYLFYLLFLLPDFSDYFRWRVELRAILEKLDYQKSDWAILSVYSFLFTFPAMVGVCLPASRKIWVFLLGGVLWLLWFQLSVVNGLATFENRYTYILIPLLTLSLAVFLDFFVHHFPDFPQLRGLLATARVAVTILVFMIVAEHFFRTDNIRMAVKRNGAGELVNAIIDGRWDEIYARYTPDNLEERESINKTAEKLMARDAGIDKLAIYDAELYYHLDPKKIPRHVTVGFLTNGYMVFHLLLDGQSFIQHSGGKMYSYLDYGKPDFREGERRALVLTIMPLENYPYSWTWGETEMYLFSYLESDHARVDISERPNITQKMLHKAYEPWYGK